MMLPTISVKFKCKGKEGVEDKLFAYDQFLNFFRTVFGLKELTSGGALLIGNALVSGDLDLVGAKLGVVVGFKNGKYHTVQAEDPNDPSKNVIKIGMKTWNKEKKKEEFEFLKGKGIGAGDRVFDTFDQANTVLDTLPNGAKFPEILKLINDKTQETPEDLLAAQEYGLQLMSGKAPQPKEETQAIEPEIVEEEEEEVPSIF